MPPDRTFNRIFTKTLALRMNNVYIRAFRPAGFHVLGKV